MSKLREIENPDAMGINAIYYKGLKKIKFLEKRLKTLRRIPKHSILGLGYTISGFDLHDGKSMDDIEHSDTVTEYVFMKSKNLFEDEICFEILSEMVFSERSKNSNGVQLEDYVKELENKGYIRMPITFRWGTLPEKIVKDFSLAKRPK